MIYVSKISFVNIICITPAPAFFSLSYIQATRNTGKTIAGQNLANPTATLLAGALLLDHLGLDSYAKVIRRATIRTLTEERVGLTILLLFSLSLIFLFQLFLPFPISFSNCLFVCLSPSFSPSLSLSLSHFPIFLSLYLCLSLNFCLSLSLSLLSLSLLLQLFSDSNLSPYPQKLNPKHLYSVI